jgi:hypothetical protein
MKRGHGVVQVLETKSPDGDVEAKGAGILDMQSGYGCENVFLGIARKELLLVSCLLYQIKTTNFNRDLALSSRDQVARLPYQTNYSSAIRRVGFICSTIRGSCAIILGSQFNFKCQKSRPKCMSCLSATICGESRSGTENDASFSHSILGPGRPGVLPSSHGPQPVIFIFLGTESGEM